MLIDYCSCGSTSVYNTLFSLEKKTHWKKNTCTEYRIISLQLKKLWTQDWNTMMDSNHLVTDILNTYVAVMLCIRGWNLLHTEELTSVQAKNDFCTYCQNVSKLQWLSLTTSRPLKHKSIKVPLINYDNISIIFFFGGATSLT